MTQAQVDAALRRLGEYRTRQAGKLAAVGKPDGISGALLLAIGLRESRLANITNQAGTDRGWLQISDRYHRDWLKVVPGCVSGTWTPAAGRTAADPGCVPRFSHAAIYAIELLTDAMDYAADQGVPDGADRVRFACDSYNAGVSGAFKGYKQGDSSAYTTGGDYGKDVFRRRTLVNKSRVFQAWSK